MSRIRHSRRPKDKENAAPFQNDDEVFVSVAHIYGQDRFGNAIPREVTDNGLKAEIDRFDTVVRSVGDKYSPKKKSRSGLVHYQDYDDLVPCSSRSSSNADSTLTSDSFRDQAFQYTKSELDEDNPRFDLIDSPLLSEGPEEELLDTKTDGSTREVYTSDRSSQTESWFDIPDDVYAQLAARFAYKPTVADPDATLTDINATLAASNVPPENRDYSGKSDLDLAVEAINDDGWSSNIVQNTADNPVPEEVPSRERKRSRSQYATQNSYIGREKNDPAYEDSECGPPGSHPSTPTGREPFANKQSPFYYFDGECPLKDCLNQSGKLSSNIKVELLYEHMFTPFLEMTVMRTPRPAYPYIAVKLIGLAPNKNYCVSLEYARSSHFKYRYKDGHWSAQTPATDEDTGTSECFLRACDIEELNDARKQPIMMSGSQWMARDVSFESVKLVNSTQESNGIEHEVALTTLHRYTPVIRIYSVSANVKRPTLRAIFPLYDASFMAVSRYCDVDNVKFRRINAMPRTRPKRREEPSSRNRMSVGGTITED